MLSAETARGGLRRTTRPYRRKCKLLVILPMVRAIAPMYITTSNLLKMPPFLSTQWRATEGLLLNALTCYALVPDLLDNRSKEFHHHNFQIFLSIAALVRKVSPYSGRSYSFYSTYLKTSYHLPALIRLPLLLERNVC